jgi:hypothetical protein
LQLKQNRPLEHLQELSENKPKKPPFGVIQKIMKSIFLSTSTTHLKVYLKTILIETMQRCIILFVLLEKV